MGDGGRYRGAAEVLGALDLSFVRSTTFVLPVALGAVTSVRPGPTRVLWSSRYVSGGGASEDGEWRCRCESCRCWDPRDGTWIGLRSPRDVAPRPSTRRTHGLVEEIRLGPRLRLELSVPSGPRIVSRVSGSPSKVSEVRSGSHVVGGLSSGVKVAGEEFRTPGVWETGAFPEGRLQRTRRRDTLRLVSED